MGVSDVRLPDQQLLVCLPELPFALCVRVGVCFFGYGHGEPGVTAARL